MKQNILKELSKFRKTNVDNCPYSLLNIVYNLLKAICLMNPKRMVINAHKNVKNITMKKTTCCRRKWANCISNMSQARSAPFERSINRHSGPLVFYIDIIDETNRHKPAGCYKHLSCPSSRLFDGKQP